MVGLNLYFKKLRLQTFKFTFQYGGIKLANSGKISLVFEKFTFQYGGIKPEPS